MKIRDILLTISGISFILFLYRLLTNVPVSSEAFPKASEKAVAENEVLQLKEEAKAAGEKDYSDEEIEKLFNK